MNELYVPTPNATEANFPPLFPLTLEEMLGDWFLLETQVAPLLEEKARLEFAIRQLTEQCAKNAHCSIHPIHQVQIWQRYAL